MKTSIAIIKNSDNSKGYSFLLPHEPPHQYIQDGLVFQLDRADCDCDNMTWTDKKG